MYGGSNIESKNMEKHPSHKWLFFLKFFNEIKKVGTEQLL